MVRHEIQHQPNIASRKSFTKLRQRRLTPKLLADRVGGDRKARAAYIVLDEVGQYRVELGASLRSTPRDRPTSRTGLPDA